MDPYQAPLPSPGTCFLSGFFWRALQLYLAAHLGLFQWKPGCGWRAWQGRISWWPGVQQINIFFMFKMQPGARPEWGIAVPSSCASKVALGSWILEWSRSTSGSNPGSWPELGSVGQSTVPVTARAQLWSPRGPFPGELDSLWVLPPQSVLWNNPRICFWKNHKSTFLTSGTWQPKG